MQCPIQNHFQVHCKLIKKLLPNLVSETQSAFMSNKLISNNILVAYETHHLKNKRKGKSGLMALKFDMSKAYNKVEWVFLEKIVGEIGF